MRLSAECCTQSGETAIICRKKKTKQKQKTKNRIKTQEKTQANYSNPYKTETSYKTGYAGTESKFERAKIKHKARKAARKAKATRTSNINPKGFFGELGRYIVRFIKSPIDTISIRHISEKRQ